MTTMQQLRSDMDRAINRALFDLESQGSHLPRYEDALAIAELCRARHYLAMCGGYEPTLVDPVRFDAEEVDE